MNHINIRVTRDRWTEQKLKNCGPIPSDNEAYRDQGSRHHSGAALLGPDLNLEQKPT